MSDNIKWESEMKPISYKSFLRIYEEAKLSNPEPDIIMLPSKECAEKILAHYTDYNEKIAHWLKELGYE